MKKINEFKERIPEIKKMLISGMSVENIATLMRLQPESLYVQLKFYSHEFEDIGFILEKRYKKI